MYLGTCTHMVDSIRQPCRDAYATGELCTLRRWRLVSVPLARPCDLCLVEGEGEMPSRRDRNIWWMFLGGIVLVVMAVLSLVWVGWWLWWLVS